MKDVFKNKNTSHSNKILASFYPNERTIGKVYDIQVNACKIQKFIANIGNKIDFKKNVR